MKSIEQLRKTAMAARNALDEAEAIERDKENARLIGQCFKYSNSGGGCDERWWLYLKVIRAEDGHLRVFTFEELPNGNISIEPDQWGMSGRYGKNSGYTKIPRTEFHAAWQALAAKVAGFPA